MFKSKHYVPILKWKRAEQGALKALEEKHKKLITPVIQFVMPKQKTGDQMSNLVVRFEEQILKIPENIVDVWGKTPIFLDFSLLFTIPLKAKGVNSILRGGLKLGASFIPVVYLNDEHEVKKVAYSFAKENGGGMCLRLVCPDFSDLEKLNQNIKEFVSSTSLAEKDIDILVDIKEIEINGDKFIKYLNLSQRIDNLSKWRTLTFASGAFPKDLSQCKIDEENLIPRFDWKNWIEQINNENFQRKPAFADYTIQHPIYIEASQFFHPSTSIKYTLEDNWLIMKGKKQKFELYLASAAELVKDTRFYGENFSDGDKYIAEKARHFSAYIKKPAIKGTGSTETWLKAGINHHLALTAHQIANSS